MFTRVVLVRSVLVLLSVSCASTHTPRINQARVDAAESTATTGRLPVADEWRRQFEERRAAGRGIFLTEEEIGSAKASTLGALLRHTAEVIFWRASSQCSPAFIVDGSAANFSTDLDMPTVGIIGIEIYRSANETPLDFLAPNNTCGTIVIWTRVGP